MMLNFSTKIDFYQNSDIRLYIAAVTKKKNNTQYSFRRVNEQNFIVF